MLPPPSPPLQDPVPFVPKWGFKATGQKAMVNAQVSSPGPHGCCICAGRPDRAPLFL